MASVVPWVLCPGCLLASSWLRAPLLPPPWRRQAPRRLLQACFAASGAPRGRIPSAPGLTELCNRIQQEYFEVGVPSTRTAVHTALQPRLHCLNFYASSSEAWNASRGVCCPARWRKMLATSTPVSRTPVCWLCRCRQVQYGWRVRSCACKTRGARLLRRWWGLCGRPARRTRKALACTCCCWSWSMVATLTTTSTARASG